MASKPSGKSLAWSLFDHIIQTAAVSRVGNPWQASPNGPTYQPDYQTLQKLLAVPLSLGSASQSGIPALALDAWTAYELRRAGFEPDSVWPRAEYPRVLPTTFTALLKEATKLEEHTLLKMMNNPKTYSGEMSASANILGKNYVKQVDVVISAWNTGPELMISTKRMDSSFGNERRESRRGELRGCQEPPRAGIHRLHLGFIYSLRSKQLFEPKHRENCRLDHRPCSGNSAAKTTPTTAWP